MKPRFLNVLKLSERFFASFSRFFLQILSFWRRFLHFFALKRQIWTVFSHISSKICPKRSGHSVFYCPKGLLCRGGSRKSFVSVCPLSVRSPSGPFSIRFQSSKKKIPVQFLRKRGPKRVPSATFGSKSEMDLGQRIIQILWRFARHKIRMRHLSFWWDFPSGDLAPQVSSSLSTMKIREESRKRHAQQLQSQFSEKNPN